MLELSEERLVGETLLSGLRHSKVDHFGNGFVAMQGHQNVRWLEIPVNDALLVGMLHGRTDVKKELQSILRREIRLVTELRDRQALHQFHHEVGATGLDRSSRRESAPIFNRRS